MKLPIKDTLTEDKSPNKTALEGTCFGSLGKTNGCGVGVEYAPYNMYSACIEKCESHYQIVRLDRSVWNLLIKGTSSFVLCGEVVPFQM